MKVLRRSRRLVRAGGRAALALGMAGAAGAVSAAARARVTAILVTSHVAAGWGCNAQGQLGDGTTTSRSLSGDIRAGSDVVQAAAGNGHGLAPRSDGTVWAWGDGSAGQLGSARSSIPVTRPVNTIGAGSGITQLSAGGFHVLALKSNGSVLAWGSNGSGQLGNGTTTDPAGAVQVTGLANATQVAAGERFSLAVHTVLGLVGS